jgi:hypothetical protein
LGGNGESTAGGSTNGDGGSQDAAMAGQASQDVAGAPAGGAEGDPGIRPTAGRLGRACSSDAECGALQCIKATDAALGGGAPPKGLCTVSCTLPTDDQPDDPCAALGLGALCFPFDERSTEGYCVEGCAFGKPRLGQVKCHNRAEFACNPALLGATNDVCQTNGDCAQGKLCSDGVCNVIRPACLPACGGDVDCAAGYYCDQSFLSGVCVKGTPQGKALGEPCTVPGPNEPDEPDECLGYCAPDSTGSTQGHCLSTCTYGTPCAWSSGTEKYDGACILVNSQIVGSSPAVGDFGFCDLTCNCAADCLDATLGCELLESALPEQFRGGGFCLEPTAQSVPYDQCGG